MREGGGEEEGFLLSPKTPGAGALPPALHRRGLLFTSPRGTPFFPTLATPRCRSPRCRLRRRRRRRTPSTPPLPARDNDIAGKEENVSGRFTTPGGADVTGAKLIS